MEQWVHWSKLRWTGERIMHFRTLRELLISLCVALWKAVCDFYWMPSVRSLFGCANRRCENKLRHRSGTYKSVIIMSIGPLNLSSEMKLRAWSMRHQQEDYKFSFQEVVIAKGNWCLLSFERGSLRENKYVRHCIFSLKIVYWRLTTGVTCSLLQPK